MTVEVPRATWSPGEMRLVDILVPGGPLALSVTRCTPPAPDEVPASMSPPRAAASSASRLPTCAMGERIAPPTLGPDGGCAGSPANAPASARLTLPTSVLRSIPRRCESRSVCSTALACTDERNTRICASSSADTPVRTHSPCAFLFAALLVLDVPGIPLSAAQAGWAFQLFLSLLLNCSCTLRCRWSHTVVACARPISQLASAPAGTSTLLR
mmetsp:Transcript_45984/g.87747  ORF Transcript_45984/g.87747 Transcript_45984/m.87747 type:complete len:213 (-) Transcript_45984:1088-1726(-)